MKQSDGASPATATKREATFIVPDGLCGRKAKNRLEHCTRDRETERQRGASPLLHFFFLSPAKNWSMLIGHTLRLLCIISPHFSHNYNTTLYNTLRTRAPVSHFQTPRAKTGTAASLAEFPQHTSIRSALRLGSLLLEKCRALCCCPHRRQQQGAGEVYCCCPAEQEQQEQRRVSC